MLNLKDFDTLAILTTYVNDESIVQANIQMVHRFDGRWYLLWWTP